MMWNRMRHALFFYSMAVRLTYYVRRTIMNHIDLLRLKVANFASVRASHAS